jgi:hypothetical protein
VREREREGELLPCDERYRSLHSLRFVKLYQGKFKLSMDVLDKINFAQKALTARSLCTLWGFGGWFSSAYIKGRVTILSVFLLRDV